MAVECKPNKNLKKLNPEIYDLVVIGGGPAGMGAALFAIRYKVNTVIVSPQMGGLMTDAHLIENYLGFNSVSGAELTKSFTDQLKYQNVPIIEECAFNISRNKKDNELFNVKTDTQIIRTKFVLITTGLARRKLGVPGEVEFSGKGITYCATCDAPVFKGLDVAVIGGGDGAASAAILAAKYGKKVYLIYRGDKLKAEPFWQDLIDETKNIEVIFNANVKEFLGEKMLKGAKLDNGKELAFQGCIIEVGSIPKDDLFKEIGVKTDKKGYIIVNEAMETNIKGIYAAGDINNSSNNFRQISTAFGEASVAANAIFTKVISKKK